MKKKILLFACIEKNIGDDLFIETICKRYPDHIFVISSGARYGTLANLNNIEFNKWLYYWQILAAANPIRKIKRITVNVLLSILKYIIGKHEVGVYIVGNAFKNTNYINKSQIRWLEERMSLSKEFYIISTNFGPYNDERWLIDAKSVFRNVTDICFRDSVSYNLFADLNNVRVAPDAILSLKVNKNMTSISKKIIISVIDCSFSARNIWLKSLSNEYEEAISELASEFIRQGYNVILLNSNELQDKPASERIKNLCNCSEKISIYNYDGNLDSLRNLFCDSVGVIGTRLHSIVLAWLYNIPVLPIIYDIKVSFMIEECKYKGKCIDIKSIGTISAKEMYNSFLYNVGMNVDPEMYELADKQFESLDKRLIKG